MMQIPFIGNIIRIPNIRNQTIGFRIMIADKTTITVPSTISNSNACIHLGILNKNPNETPILHIRVRTENYRTLLRQANKT
ncbi:MAG: hypothetical protein H0X50_11110 [Nitrosopumilus sp.]|nr:hypothetical protein [Nitrosopumilus sp.]